MNFVENLANERKSIPADLGPSGRGRKNRIRTQTVAPMRHEKSERRCINRCIASNRPRTGMIGVLIDVSQNLVASQHHLVDLGFWQAGESCPLFTERAQIRDGLRRNITLTSFQRTRRGVGDEQRSRVIAVRSVLAELAPSVFEDMQRIRLLAGALGQGFCQSAFPKLYSNRVASFDKAIGQQEPLLANGEWNTGGSEALGGENAQRSMNRTGKFFPTIPSRQVTRTKLAKTGGIETTASPIDEQYSQRRQAACSL